MIFSTLIFSHYVFTNKNYMDFYHGFNTSKNHYLEKQILDLFHSLSVPGNTHPNFDELYYRKIFEQSDSSKMYYIYTINTKQYYFIENIF